MDLPARVNTSKGQRLLEAFDLHLPSSEEEGPTWLNSDDLVSIAPLLRTAGGDWYAAWHARLSKRSALVYVGSEGRAACLSPDVLAGVMLLIELPYWRDLLKPEPRTLREYRGLASTAERELRSRRRGIDKKRDQLAALLGASRPRDPIESLWRELARCRFKPRFTDGANLVVLGVTRARRDRPIRPAPLKEVRKYLGAVDDGRSSKAEAAAIARLVSWATSKKVPIEVAARLDGAVRETPIRTRAELQEMVDSPEEHRVYVRVPSVLWISFVPRAKVNLNGFAPLMPV